MHTSYHEDWHCHHAVPIVSDLLSTDLLICWFAIHWFDQLACSLLWSTWNRFPVFVSKRHFVLQSPSQCHLCTSGAWQDKTSDNICVSDEWCHLRTKTRPTKGFTLLPTVLGCFIDHWICTGSTPNLQTGTPVVAAINFRPKRRAASPKLAAAYKQGFNGWIQFQSELGALRLKSVGNIYARDENTPSSSPTQSTHYGPLTNTKPSWYADPWQRKALKKNLWSFHIKGKGESNTFRL